ncbi:MAG: DNA alkylation repair protein [Candidatus Hydrogenedentes bacterium]|nr:DNA alkylation repair protein [Candidatus Hydrogenedentota bacterium]
MKKLSRSTLRTLATRKGALRRDDVSSELRHALNTGRLETKTLSEWLVVDHRTLLQCAARDAGIDDRIRDLLAGFQALEDEGITRRMRGVGALLHQALAAHTDRDTAFNRLAGHNSDVVRSWAAYAVSAHPKLTMRSRLAKIRPFAADANMAVREAAWDAFRPWLDPGLEKHIPLLLPWVHDTDPNVRRCAVEATRPCGVWTAHLGPMKANPALGLPLLEPVRADPSRYVQNAVANWLNDASKSAPDWVKSICARWAKESSAKETAYIVRRAQRTLNKT